MGSVRSVNSGLAFSVFVLYALLIWNSYNISSGFQNRTANNYPFWKSLPVFFLSLFSLFHGHGAEWNDRFVCFLGLLAGSAGDYLIAAYNDGIVPGAVAFGVGHLLFLSFFSSRKYKFHVPSALVYLLSGAVITSITIVPQFTKHPIAVSIMLFYSLILTHCTVVSTSQYFSLGDKYPDTFYRFIGFLLFLISDSNLILKVTGYIGHWGEYLILSTYYLSEYFIMHSNLITNTKVHVQ